MNRGRRGEDIFSDEKDYVMFTELLKETSEMWTIRVASYCLMPNHIPYAGSDPRSEHFKKHAPSERRLPRRCKSLMASESRRQGGSCSELLRALGNAGSGDIWLSRRVKKMQINRANPGLHHLCISRTGFGFVFCSMRLTICELFSIFFMQHRGLHSELQ